MTLLLRSSTQRNSEVISESVRLVSIWWLCHCPWGTHTIAHWNKSTISRSIRPLRSLTVPGPPSDIKAISVDEHTILVSWLDPRAISGRIVMYSVFMKTMESGRQFTQKYEVYPPRNHFSVRGLNQNQPYRGVQWIRFGC